MQSKPKIYVNSNTPYQLLNAFVFNRDSDYWNNDQLIAFAKKHKLDIIIVQRMDFTQ